MKLGKEKWKYGGPSAQTSDDDPPWMYHQPAPDPWEQTLNKWEQKKMAYEHNPGKGTMFYNDNSESNSKAPRWSGSVKVPEGWGGKTMDIAAWHNEGTEDRKERWSISLSEPWVPKSETSTSSSDGSKWMKPAPETKTEDKDDIPW